jgi:hypothetical protein
MVRGPVRITLLPPVGPLYAGEWVNLGAGHRVGLADHFSAPVSGAAYPVGTGATVPRLKPSAILIAGIDPVSLTLSASWGAHPGNALGFG